MHNFDPASWGPGTWVMLNSIFLALPENVPLKQQNAVRQLLESLTHLLPCENCRHHYTDYYRRNPPDISRQSLLWEWLTELHNRVNLRTGKSTMTPEEAKDNHINVIRNKSYSINSKTNLPIIENEKSKIPPAVYILLIGAVIAFILFIISSKRKRN